MDSNMSAFDRDFRRRSRPGWMRSSEAEVVPIRRLRGLDEFETPEFVGRMERIARARKHGWWALVAAAIVGGLAIGLAI